MVTTAATTSPDGQETAALRTLPGDEIRQILWRLTERFDLQMLAQSVRGVARGPVARLVAAGGRNTHEWTPEKNAILTEYDNCGLTALFMNPEDGGYIEGPKNLALAIAAFELAWVDAGAATGSLATCLALAPIHERGTEEQRRRYKSLCVPQPGVEPWRGAFALTEPLPYVGVETGLLSGRVRVAEWNDGEEPVLEVNKRGRFITNMGFANFVTAAVDSGDERIKGSCMVILEEGDPGSWDRGTPTRKLVHQLSSTNDPVFQIRVPASRIIGGYTINAEGVIVPNYSHGEVIEAVFKRTRITVGLMTAAKLLSAIEPLIRYHRDRFRGGDTVAPGSPRYEFGLQQRGCTPPAIGSMGDRGGSCLPRIRSGTVFRRTGPDREEKDRVLAERGIKGGTAAFKALRKVSKDAVEFLRQTPGTPRSELAGDPLVQFIVMDAEANVLCPATKLWNTGHGANVMREAVSLMGGYGITEDCPGFLGHKWMDAQLEATYEGPGGGPAAATQHHDDQRSVPREVPQLDSRDARDCLSEAGNGSLRAGLGDEPVAVDNRSSAGGDRRGWRPSVPECAARCELPAGGCAGLAAVGSPVHSRCSRVGTERSRESDRGGGDRRNRAVLSGPGPHAGRASGGRGGEDLRRVGVWIPAASRVGRIRV